MNLKSIILISLLLISISMSSQVIILQGIISSDVDIEFEGLNIQNLTLGKSSITNAKGEFQIPATLHDTLSISALHIQTILVIIEDEHMLRRNLNINLIEKLNELEAVNLRRTALLGFISSDANLIPTIQFITASSIGLPNANVPRLTRTQRSIYTATNPEGIDPLINAISGRTKMLKNRLKGEKTRSFTLQLLDKFPDTYFISSLEIEQGNIYSFLFFCEDDSNYDIVMKQSNIKIIEF